MTDTWAAQLLQQVDLLYIHYKRFMKGGHAL